MVVAQFEPKVIHCSIVAQMKPKVMADYICLKVFYINKNSLGGNCNLKFPPLLNNLFYWKEGVERIALLNLKYS